MSRFDPADLHGIHAILYALFDGDKIKAMVGGEERTLWLKVKPVGLIDQVERSSVDEALPLAVEGRPGVKSVCAEMTVPTSVNNRVPVGLT